jgi:hypothetical protein
MRHYQGRPGNGLLFLLFCGVKTMTKPTIAYMESSPKLAARPASLVPVTAELLWWS